MSIKTQITRVENAVTEQSETISNIADLLEKKGIIPNPFKIKYGEEKYGSVKYGQDKTYIGTPLEINGYKLIDILNSIENIK